MKYLICWLFGHEYYQWSIGEIDKLSELTREQAAAIQEVEITTAKGKVVLGRIKHADGRCDRCGKYRYED